MPWLQGSREQSPPTETEEQKQHGYVREGCPHYLEKDGHIINSITHHGSTLEIEDDLNFFSSQLRKEDMK